MCDFDDDLVAEVKTPSDSCEFVESVNGRHSGLIIWICERHSILGRYNFMISRLNILGRYIFTIEYEYASQYSRKIQFYDCVKYFEKFQPLAQRLIILICTTVFSKDTLLQLNMNICHNIFGRYNKTGNKYVKYILMKLSSNIKHL